MTRRNNLIVLSVVGFLASLGLVNANAANAGSIILRSTSNTEMTYASGAQSSISDLSATIPVADIYWAFVATNLSNGAFYQAGWQENYPGKCGGAKSYFVYGQNADQTQQLWQSQCSVTAAAHQFRILLTSSSGNQNFWRAYVDGVEIPGSLFSAGTGHDSGGANSPYGQTEQVANTNPAQHDMPRVHFGPALQWRFGSTWYDPAHAKTDYATETQYASPFCRTPYWYTGNQIANPTANHALLGDGVNGSAGCKTSGYQVW